MAWEFESPLSHHFKHDNLIIMQVSVETIEGLGRKMTIELPQTDIDSKVAERLQSISKTARINGFRPGKVPMNVVKKRFEPQVKGEVLGALINDSFYKAVQQESLRPAGQPEIKPVEGAEQSDDGFSYEATFEVYPEFDPKFDESLKIVRPVVEIQSTDVDEMVNKLLEQRKDYSAVDRAAADGDQIVIDFTGRLDGEEFDGGKAEKAPLVLGSNQMIPGFEEQLVGLKSDDKKTIKVTFPEQYQAENLAGKECEFDIVVHEVKEPSVPELDEELVKSFGIEDGSIDSLRADIEKNMERELKARLDNDVKTQVMDGLLELNPIDVPAALVTEEIVRQREQFMEKMKGQAEMDGSNLPDELFAEQAKRRVRLGLIVGEIVRRDSITADAGKVREQVEHMAGSYQDPQQVIDYYYSNPELLQNIEGLVLEDTVTEAVVEKSSVTDESRAFADVMNPPAPDSVPNEAGVEST